MRRCGFFIGAAILLLGGPASSLAATLAGRVTTPEGKPVADAVVFVQEPEAAGANPSRTATMDQIDKTFVPGVLPIVVGTRVSFPNHDQIHHHVYSFSRTKSFELPLYKGEDAKPVLFDKVGVVKVGCNIHDWMSGIILVLPTPWFAKTDAEGRWQIDHAPGGKYTVVAWHELSKQKPEETAQPMPAAEAATELKFVLTLGAARTRPVMHGSRRDP
jgi:plastocyanin